MSLITVTQTVQQAVSAIACDAAGCAAQSLNQQDPAWAHIQIPLGPSWAGNQKPQRDFCSIQHLVSALQMMHEEPVASDKVEPGEPSEDG